MIDVVDAPAAGTVPATVEAWTALEHQEGVLPLVGAFFREGGLPEVVSGRVLGALGLFTPTPDPGWEAAAVAGEPDGDGALLQGDIRLPSPLAGGAVVLARLGTEHRLAWIDHDAPGVERRGSRTGGPAGDGPFWLHFDGSPVRSERISRPVTLAPGSELVRHLEAYAGAWAAAAAAAIREGVRALRRAARTSAFNKSQEVALGITEVEIEGDLVAAAVRHGGGLAVAVAAARTLSAVAAKTDELRDVYGLAVDGPFAGAAARTLTAFLGGPPLLENELARALGIPEVQA